MIKILTDLTSSPFTIFALSHDKQYTRSLFCFPRKKRGDHFKLWRILCCHCGKAIADYGRVSLGIIRLSEHFLRNKIILIIIIIIIIIIITIIIIHSEFVLLSCEKKKRTILRFEEFSAAIAGKPWPIWEIFSRHISAKRALSQK